MRLTPFSPVSSSGLMVQQLPRLGPVRIVAIAARGTPCAEKGLGDKVSGGSAAANDARYNASHSRGILPGL